MLPRLIETDFEIHDFHYLHLRVFDEQSHGSSL